MLRKTGRKTLGRLETVRVGHTRIHLLFSPEHDVCVMAMGDGMKHAELVPLIIAAREADARYADWLRGPWGL